MAKLSAHGAEIARVLNPRNGALVSYRADGTTLVRTVCSGGWKLHRKIKAGYSLEDWKARKLAIVAEQPAWCRDVDSLPSMATLEEWMRDDGSCETPSGDRVEPDGTGPDGAPSWLRLFGMI